MLDWLKRDPAKPPSIELAGRTLPIVIRRLAQSRRLTLRLAPDGSEVRVSMPRWGRTAEALEFARTRADWLARQVAAIPEQSEMGPPTSLDYLGVQMAIVHDSAATRRVRRVDDAIICGGPADGLRARLRRWLEAEARSLLADDLAYYCALAGREVPKLSLSNARRRWGSCAASGAIRINWRLVMAPEHVRRSVVAHEVAHLVHFDHSPAFHALLAQLFEGEIGEANRWLKSDGRGLYATFG